MSSNLYIIADCKEAALKVARLVCKGKLPNIYATREAVLKAHSLYPTPARRNYSPYEIPRYGKDLTQCTKIFA